MSMDKGKSKDKAPPSLVVRYILLLMLVWTVAITGSLMWNVFQVKETTLENARIQARIAYEKDVIYRSWNSEHGGVYVFASEDTPPNPYLSNISERDIELESGEVLTLMNPAYMTRKVHELSEERFGTKGHITSLNPLRPLNRPDPWEEKALKEFEKGVEEVNSVEVLDGEEYMRLMRPLVTEESCLKCHAHQGYQVGDVRGGISVAVPMAQLRGVGNAQMKVLLAAHFLLWIFGLGFLGLGGQGLLISDRKRRKAEEATMKYADELEEANMLKDLFTDIMRHDLLNPAGAVRNFTEILMDREESDEKRMILGRVHLSSSKLIDMIESASLYSKLESMDEIERRRLNLKGIITDLVHDFDSAPKEKDIRFDLKLEGDYPIKASSMLENIFINLISNAVKYASDGGRIEVGILDEGEEWTVYVKDWGEGISDGSKDKIFTRFERVGKEGVKGTGLGLAIAKRITDLHGGSIWIEDNPEGGSVFLVRLPKGADIGKKDTPDDAPD
jgi:signal transduction histidine kinase